MSTPDLNPDAIYVLDKRVRLLQPVQGFRTSMDSVVLAAACPAKEGDRVLDLGCGVGSAGLCVLERIEGTELCGVDIEPHFIELAVRNADLNGMAPRTEFFVHDVRKYKGTLADHVICNPPYLDAGQYMPSPARKKVVALYHTDEDMSVQHWIKAAHHNVKDGGSLCMIHRADQSDKIIASMKGLFGGIEVVPLWPRAGEPAKRVIIRALKNRRSPATLHPGIVLHAEDGRYTAQADAILRGAYLA